MGSQGESATESKRYLKVSIFFNKKPDITDEEFHRYWAEEHATLFTSLPVSQKFGKYNQYHNSMEARRKAESLGLPTMEFDAVAELWTEDVDTFLTLLQDPDYLEKLVPDENKFLTREGSKFMFGYDDLKLDRT